jgi:hypothetical protein
MYLVTYKDIRIMHATLDSHISILFLVGFVHVFIVV